MPSKSPKSIKPSRKPKPASKSKAPKPGHELTREELDKVSAGTLALSFGFSPYVPVLAAAKLKP